MCTDCEGSTGLVGRIGHAKLRSARKHVDDAGLSVRRLGFVRCHIRTPLARRLVRTRCGTAKDFGVARLAREAAAAFAQNHSLAVRISADDPGEFGNALWTRSYRPLHLDFSRLARSTAALSHVHMIVIVRLLHLRSDRTSLPQQQTGQKDDGQAIPSDEFHRFPSLSSGNYGQ
jgi:hypothetical protein